MEDLTRAEWTQWQDVCAQLVTLRAVTPADLQASTTAAETPGQRLLNALRQWGALRARQGAQ
jgi:hypothetical protein